MPVLGLVADIHGDLAGLRRALEIFARELRERHAVDANVRVKTPSSRLGLDGEVFATPGHSDDSVTLILDDGLAFTGDLPPPYMVPDESGMTERSWEAIRACGVHTVYPGHGPSFRL